MIVNEALKYLQKVVEAGHGEAVLYHLDTRSGIGEECSCSDEAEENVELASGEILPLALAFYEGG